MDKLPPTPSKPPPPSSSLNSSPPFLPPRPPPQIRPVIPILPALPMSHHQKQQRKFPTQGVGRGGGLQGHASLPPKPGIPGKPLPRDTGPIVLTGGKDNTGSGGFSYSHVAKRTYPSTAMTRAESPPAARREPVMTALAPASQVRVAASPVHHHKQLVAATITPPAEMMTRPFADQAPSLMNYGSDSDDVGTRTGDQISSQQAGMDSQTQTSNDIPGSKPHAEPAYSSTMRSEMISQQPNFLSFPHQNFYENIQENGIHPNRNSDHINGHDTPMHNGLLSDGYSSYILPPPLLPPHPHSRPHLHLQQHQGFVHHVPHDTYQFPNSMTPPNTGTMFVPPPPFQPHGTFDSSNKTSERGGSTNPQTPFTPTHPFPVHLELPHHNPHMSVFPLPPSDHMVHFNNPHHEQHPQENQTFECTLEVSQDYKPKQPSIIESNSLLRNISFFPSDSDQQHNDTVAGNTILPSGLSNMGLKVNQHPAENQREQPNGYGSQTDLSHGSVFGVSDSRMAAAHRLQSYSLRYYLSDRLSDVKLSVNRIGGTFDWNFEEFNAHSFILGRSVKLAGLIEDQITKDERRLLQDSGNFGVAWANGMENGRKNDYSLPITSPTRKVTVLLQTNDKYISRDSFLLSLRWLYGGADWELDAYLDPSHPRHRTLEWTRNSTEKADDFSAKHIPDLTNPSGQDNGHQGEDKLAEQIPLENNIQDTKSEEVRMLDRSISLFATGTFLGIDEVIEKGAWGIRRWGMRLEGGAFERLLDFVLSASGDVDFNKVSTNDADEPGERYRLFAKHLLDEAVVFLVKSLPHPFKFDSRAPPSSYLVRLPKTSRPSSAAPVVAIDSDLSGPAKLRQVYSTILLSVPFGLLRTILEHDGFATRNSDWKGIARYDIAKAVVHERERRRKYGFKLERERRASTYNEMDGVGVVDEQNSDSSMSLVHLGEKEGFECEDLHWEESVLCTFGHGGNGLEITRRRKGGGVGGRVLWKVGESSVRV